MKYKIELFASPREVWITILATGHRYKLPEEEYIKRYTREKERQRTAEVIAVHYEWGYVGHGPNLLTRAIADELFDNPTDEQKEIIKNGIASAPKGNGEIILEFQ